MGDLFMKRFLKKSASLLLAASLLWPTAVPASAAIEGDADGDGGLTPADARLVLRCAVGLETMAPELLSHCDLDADGSVTPADARLTLRHAVGLFTESISPGDPARQPSAKPSGTEYMQTLTGMVSSGEVAENFGELTGKAGSRWYTSDGIVQGRDWIRRRLCDYGFDGSEIILDRFVCKEQEAFNVFTKITTAARDPAILLFVAHYDSHHAGTGAVDNASGVCTVLEIARILKDLNKNKKVDFGVEIRFLFTACEEQGFYGGYRYVNGFASRSLDRHAAVFNVDMSAHFKNGGNHYLCVSTLSSYGSLARPNRASLAVDAARRLVGSCGEYAYRSPVAAGWHDLIPFEKNGVPGITLSWREINYDNSHGSQDGLAAPAETHTRLDVAENTDMDSLYRTTRLAVAAAAALVYDYLP